MQLYADENFSLAVTLALRALGHDVLTVEMLQEVATEAPWRELARSMEAGIAAKKAYP